MAHSLNKLDSRTLQMVISGVFDPEDLLAQQEAARALIAEAGKINALIVLKNFQGFKRGVDWDDMEFYAAHANDIGKIAFVGDAVWKDHALLFTCAGMRATEVKYFLPTEFSQAVKWLSLQTHADKA